ncbi:RNA-binding protein 1-like isoform X1 [Solanum lycopersicum]|uniref:RNA-binding protein 1-like isoform X1 n=1 Tax=Solanum lycopersicum TaxID=4081 RepID=UPI000276729F|nr:RNA-binding protein 1-like isoform X1 [Solanum lycopersicum]XP_025887287.1 RNA-binding protein 1-like isoform X1 [Solanum lycopersicum]
MSPDLTPVFAEIPLNEYAPEDMLPPNASSTLYVEGLPEDCTTREVAHIFHHFGGYKEVRLVPEPSIYPRVNTLIHCFVDFVSPLHAAAAMDALQGYKFDLDEHDSGNLMLQFARNPGETSAGGDC